MHLELYAFRNSIFFLLIAILVCTIAKRVPISIQSA